jgi:hypothetical protein
MIELTLSWNQPQENTVNQNDYIQMKQTNLKYKQAKLANYLNKTV